MKVILLPVSDFYSDEELLSELAMFFDSDEDIDLNSCLGMITEVDDDTLEVKVKGRTFRFDKVLCDVEEVE